MLIFLGCHRQHGALDVGRDRVGDTPGRSEATTNSSPAR
jgi:hypothetical protein